MKTMYLFWIFSLLLLGFRTNSFSQKVFFESEKSISENSISGAFDIVSGDLDNDGFSDIAIASYRNNSVSWVKNEIYQTGKFSSIKLIDTDFETAGLIKFADFDKDNQQDILVAGYRRTKIDWFKNSNGTFMKQNKISNDISGISDIVTDDLDNDNDIDILVSFWENGKIAYFENTDGKGNFSGLQIIEDSLGIVSKIAFKDIDGDNKKDIIALLFNQGKIVWYKGNNNLNNFSAKSTIKSNISELRALLIEDIDDDGNNDIIATLNRNVTIFKNTNGNAIFNTEQIILEDNYSIYDILASDIDKDGDKDLIIGSSESGEVVIMKNSNGNFNISQSILTNINGVYAIGTDDFNKDNLTDICAASFYNNELVWSKSKNGTDFEKPDIILKSELTYPNEFACGDFDNDGQKDFIVSNKMANNLIMERNEGNEQFSFKIIDTWDNSIDRKIDKADINKDGYLDLIVCAKSNLDYKYILKIYENINGNGNFNAKVININNLPDIDCMKAYDIDSDKDIDIVFLSKNTNFVGFANNINGSFSPDLILITDKMTLPSVLTISDFNNDALPDMVIGSYTNNTLGLVTQSANPMKFELKFNAIPLPQPSPYSLASGDLDGDGFADLAYSSSTDYRLYILKNKKNNNFNISLPIQENYYSRSDVILIEDVDNDNDNDVIEFSSGYQNLNWFENSGTDAIFTSRQNITHKSGDAKIIFDDINNDSFGDIAYLGLDQDKLLWFKSNEPPVVTKQPVDTSICNTGLTNFNIEIENSDSIRWQVKPLYHYEFSDLYNDSIYNGSNTKTMTVNASIDFDAYNYRCKYYYKGHAFISDTAILHVNRLIVANAGDDRNICIDNSYLQANYPWPGIGQWTVIAGNALIENPSSDYTKISNLAMGNNIFRWTITNGVCVNNDEIIISRKDSLFIISQPDIIKAVPDSKVEISFDLLGEADSYQWSYYGFQLDDTDNIQGTKTSKLTIKNVKQENLGSYSCFITAYCNSLSTHNILLEFTTATDEFALNNWTIFPNPASNQITIHNHDLIKGQVILSNIWGQNIFNIPINDEFKLIDVSTLPEGIYFIKIENKGLSEIKKFVKQK